MERQQPITRRIWRVYRWPSKPDSVTTFVERLDKPYIESIAHIPKPI